MTSLPCADDAVVDPRKVIDYLLNMDHPDGSSKARFFMRFGFRPSDPAVLVDALLTHARERHVHQATVTEFGPRFALHCLLRTPDGRNPCIVTVWQMDRGSDRPKLLTARPR